MLIEAGMQTCAKRVKSVDGPDAESLALRSQPEQKVSAPANVPPALPRASDGFRSADSAGSQNVGHKISAPVPLLQPDAEYSDDARRKGISGICLIQLIVDAYGMPQNVHIIKSLEPSLDQSAIEAVKKYRFKPAMIDGTRPVPVVVNVEVNFRLYKKK
jgi:protein TonB